MRKEVVVAILLGFGVGLVVTMAVITARKALETQKQRPDMETSTTVDSAPAEEQQSVSPEHTLSVSYPKNGEVVAKAEVTITGMTSPKSVVAIASEDDDFMTEADDVGRFSQDVELIGGANVIEVVSFSPTGEQVRVELMVVYTTAEF